MSADDLRETDLDHADPTAAFEQLSPTERRVLWRSVVQLEAPEVTALQEGLDVDEVVGIVRAAVRSLRRTHLELRDHRA